MGDTGRVSESASVIVVEDDDELRGLLVRGLSSAGFDTSGLSHGGDLLRVPEDRRPDLVVLDIGLPDADGRDVCLAMRAAGFDGPILFLTARDAVVDRVSGLDAGGDDYVVKPFALAELEARVRALLRRHAAVPSGDATELRLDPVGHVARLGEAACDLSATEFRLLSLLLARHGSPVRRSSLIAAGWPPGARVNDNALEAFIARLRRKLASLPGAPGISTVRGVGYRLR